jgi:hypothetical protein
MVKIIYTDKEKKELYSRLLPFISGIVHGLRNTYTCKELSDLSGVPQNRISEIISETYINEEILRKLIGGELITMAQIKTGVKLTQKDEEYLKKLVATSSPALVRRLIQVMDSGGDPTSILEKWLKENK